MKALAAGVSLFALASLSHGQGEFVVNNGAQISGARISYAFEPPATAMDLVPGRKVALRLTVATVEKDALTSPQVFNDTSGHIGVPMQPRPLSTNEPGTTTEGAAVFKSQYKFSVEPSDEATPKTYELRLSFRDGRGRRVETYFDLPVGAPDTSFLEIRSPERVHVSLTSQRYVFTIHNKYAEYPIRVYGYEVHDQNGLLVDWHLNSKQEDPIVEIRPGRQEDLTVTLQGATTKAFFASPAQPKLTMTVWFDDTHRSMQKTSPPFEVPYQFLWPAYATLLTALVFGVVGAIVRGMPVFSGRKVKKGGWPMHLVVGAVSAGLVWLLSFAAGIQLIGFGDKALASATTPLGSLLLGMAAGLAPPASVGQWFRDTLSLQKQPAAKPERQP